MTTPLIDPGSFLNLINLQHLEIVNHDGNESYSRYKNVDISYDIERESIEKQIEHSRLGNLFENSSFPTKRMLVRCYLIRDGKKKISLIFIKSETGNRSDDRLFLTCLKIDAIAKLETEDENNDEQERLAFTKNGNPCYRIIQKNDPHVRVSLYANTC
ncbi:unnamed protein product [Rhizophagus irregularis]|nr:unnamed protein product [Rhizophagus irregularis]